VKIPKTNLKQFEGGVKPSSGRIGKGLGPAYSKEVASIGHPLLGRSASGKRKDFKDLMSDTYGRSKII